MDRRTFSKLAGLGAMSALTPAAEAELLAVPEHTSESIAVSHGMAQIPVRAVEWPSRTYRRLLVDTHVPDWDDTLLANFNAEDYVSTIAAAGFQSLMQYANSHAGLCLWPTKIGQVHRNMKS